MTSNHPLRRLLTRVCSPDTMARIVDPTLADIRCERGRPAWLGYAALFKALALHAVTSAPETARRVYADDDHAVPRAIAFAMAAAVVAAVLLPGVPFISTILRAPVPPAHALARGLLMMTEAMVVTLPAALLVAIPLALQRQQPSARLVRRIVGLSIAWAAITFALLVWVTPVAGRAYRELAAGEAIAPPLGGERLSGLKQEIERLRTFHGSGTIVRRLQYEYEVRLALVAASVPLGLAALAIAFSRAGRRRPTVIGVASAGVYVLVLFPIEPLAVEFVLRTTSLPVSPLAWVPNAALVFIAGVLFAIRRPLQLRNPSLLPPPSSPAA